MQSITGSFEDEIKKFPKCEHEIKTINSNNPIHDSITQAFLFATNQVRLAPLIGIGKPLGAKGTHFTPEYFYKKGLENWNMQDLEPQKEYKYYED